MNKINNIIDLSKILSNSMEMYKKNFQFFISLSLFYGVFNLATRQIINNFFKKPEEAIFLIIITSSLILCRIAIMLIYASYKLRSGLVLSFAKVFEETKGRYLRYVAVYMSVLFLMGMGFVFFVLPGLFIGAIFMFADVIVVLENKKYTEAFKGSIELIKGKFWIVLQFLLILTMLSLTPILFIKFFQNIDVGLTKAAVEIFSVIFIPFYMISQVQLYCGLKEANSSEYKNIA
ncbi:MAG: hypothetical protein P9X22_09560 [Candidatus Zapsychrus exili]|nr:hypothetical protein [Candidatus Zapsychrus exili]